MVGQEINTQNVTQAIQKATDKVSVKSLLADPKYKNRFDELMGKRSAAFISSIVSAVKVNKDLQLCEPQSVILAGVMAATLDLPVDGNLGFAAIVPYNSRDGKKAQFQIMAKGFVQLGIRSGQYKKMGVSRVYEGQLVSWDELTSSLVLNLEGKSSDKIVGYASYFQLLNGFESYLYMSIDDVKAHGKKYSKSFSSQYGKWQTDFDVMALKTVKKLNLSRWGILSVDMQTAMKVDQGVIKNENVDDDSSIDFPDNASDGSIDAEYTVMPDEEVKEDKPDPKKA